MSINHLTTPELNIDVKSLKINGAPIGSSGTITEFVPNFSSATADTFANKRCYYLVNGNHLELFINAELTTGTLNNDAITVFIANPQGREFKLPVVPQYITGQMGGINTQVGFTSGIALATTANILTSSFKSTNATIPVGTVFNLAYNVIVELVA